MPLTFFPQFAEFWHSIRLLARDSSNPGGREQTFPRLHLPLPVPGGSLTLADQLGRLGLAGGEHWRWKREYVCYEEISVNCLVSIVEEEEDDGMIVEMTNGVRE